ncbi:MAG: SIS domain-containing protein [Tissierellia bacterium]|nr:SIS domain-containing protein [Tissierellia bacterium]
MINLELNAGEMSGSSQTLREIYQQPELWKDTFNIYRETGKEIDEFIKEIKSKHEKIRIIFTGAGTSEYVGNVLVDYLNSKENIFESIATTNLVSNPNLYFDKTATILISFARSGNSPESLAAVNLADKLVDDIYHIAITCAKEGKLAVKLQDRENAKVVLMPEKSNDKGFAMTGSFSCMLLYALLTFDKNDIETKERYVESAVKLGEDVENRKEEIRDLVNFDFNRIVYLGSGVFYPLTNEARLKILELTAGEVVTCNESSMGFRHGPKSFINEDTLVVSFVSPDSYTSKYDIDILNEISSEKIAKKILAITTNELDCERFLLENQNIEEIYLVLPYVMVAQLIAIITSLRIGNTPDTPSKTGTVNRVVKGVIIHEL